MSGGVQKRWLSVKSRIIRSYFEKMLRFRKNPKRLKKELVYYSMIKKFIYQERITPFTIVELLSVSVRVCSLEVALGFVRCFTRARPRMRHQRSMAVNCGAD